MINPVVFSAVEKINCKKFDVKNTNTQNYDLPCAKNLQSQSCDKFIKQGPTCGVDCCAI